jgi:hypothetical protein
VGVGCAGKNGEFFWGVVENYECGLVIED